MNERQKKQEMLLVLQEARRKIVQARNLLRSAEKKKLSVVKEADSEKAEANYLILSVAGKVLSVEIRNILSSWKNIEKKDEHSQVLGHP